MEHTFFGVLIMKDRCSFSHVGKCCEFLLRFGFFFVCGFLGLLPETELRALKRIFVLLSCWFGVVYLFLRNKTTNLFPKQFFKRGQKHAGWGSSYNLRTCSMVAVSSSKSTSSSELCENSSSADSSSSIPLDWQNSINELVETMSLLSCNQEI